MKLALENAPGIISAIEMLAKENGYTKIFAKIQSTALPVFLSNKFEIEAFIPRFYNNKTNCFFVSKFLDKNRKKISEKALMDLGEMLKSTKRSKQLKYKHSLKYFIKKLGYNDAESISAVFKKVFKTYPFPVHDPNYILETMTKHGTQYFGVLDGTKLIGVSSAEIDLSNTNVEMTDFAVMPEYRGQNLAFRLLINMEQAMKVTNIKTCYTIARLEEPGMNKTFLKSGYSYTGTLINNTNISGSIESMNILYKHI